MMSKLPPAILLALLASVAPAMTQQRATVEDSTHVQELGYKGVPNFFKLPKGEYFGETQGIATNSKGHVFVYFRDPQTRLWEFDQNGNFVKEIGKGYYGFLYAHALRIDRHDNIWAVDEGTNMVTKFDPTGTKVLMVIGWRPEVSDGISTAGAPTGPDENYTLCRPTDVAWDAQDDIFISDGYCNNRVVKYDKYGKFLAKIGKRQSGKGEGEFNLPHSIQVDKAGNVYVADRGNARYVVLDNNLKWKTSYNNYGSAWSVCISTEGPKQYLFMSNSNPNGNGPGTWAQTGQIYKAELDGTVIGKFGHAGKLAPGFQVVHMMDCRNPNTIFVGEIESWRSQKFVLGTGK
jgi:sugar lactone lactonase YvrE